MQVAKYWRNRKLRYRLEGLARHEARAIVAIVRPDSDKAAGRNGLKPLKREPARLLQ